HQDGLGGGSNLDSVFLEAQLHAAIELALNRPTAAVGATDLADDRHHRTIHLVDAPKLEIAADRGAEFRLPAHFIDDVLEDLPGAIGILLVGNIDADGGIARATA